MVKYLLVVAFSLSLFAFGCAKEEMSHAPTGDDCPENVAYLQDGVNKYKSAFNDYPSNVELLLASKDGKGPFVEEVPLCPSGNIYVIENGTVKEAPPK